MPDRMTPERLAHIERVFQPVTTTAPDGQPLTRDSDTASLMRQVCAEVRRCWAQMEAQRAAINRLTEQLRANGLKPDLRPAKK